MSRKSASLLTKTQRRRLQNDFEDLDESKKQRDQQRIRNRLYAGTLDFQLLASIPDKQLKLAFNDVSDEELRKALSNAHLTIERVREVREYSQENLIKNARSHAEEYAKERSDLRSIENLDLRTEDEVRIEAETETKARLVENRWTKYANGTMALGAIGFVFSTLLWSLDQLFGTSFWAGNNGHAAVVFFLIFLGVSGWTIIMGLNILKHDISPFLTQLVENPSETLRSVWIRWIPKGARSVISKSDTSE